MAARFVFGAASKLEGDLARVEVDLRRGTRVLTTRIVDFDDKHTIVEGKGDHLLYVNDIGVEGYQKSNMVEHHRADLTYGVLVRGIPKQCDALRARAIDVGGHVATSELITVPDQTATDEFVDFEDGQLPPAGWVAVTSAGGEAGPACRSTPRPLIPGHGGCSASMSRRPRQARSAPVSSTHCRRAGSNGERRAGSIRRVWSWATVSRAMCSISSAARASVPRRASTTTRRRCDRARREERGRRVTRTGWTLRHRAGRMAQVAAGARPAGDA